MSEDFDKRQWQAEQAARDAALEKEREKHRKARERSARNAKRKLERLKCTLEAQGEISDFEGEFSDSVLERIDEFGAAFADPQLGRPGDALSSAQKRVVAQMNRKVKDLKKKSRQSDDAEDDDLERPRFQRAKPRSSFQSKRKSGWTPRVRQLDEDFETEAEPNARDELKPVARSQSEGRAEADTPMRPPVGKPFLRLVKNDL
jgi:hypothetical protein